MKKIIFYTAVASISLGAATAQAETWDLALAYSATNYHSEIATAFADEVSEKTDLDVVAHPGGSLFAGAEIYGAVRRGLAPMGERLISALANENPIFEVDSVPFLATGFDGAAKLYAASKPALVDTLKEDGLVFLYSCPWPPQGFYSVAEASDLASLKGLKFRAYNATTSRMAEGLGMVPTTIEAAELSQAFATGVAQSMISSGSTGFDRKLWEEVDYFYDVQAWLPRNMVFANGKAWEGLDEEAQNAVHAAAANAEKACWSKAEELAGWYVEQFAENGMTVGTLEGEVLDGFLSVGAELRADWEERAGDKGVEIIKSFEAE
ncbi:TRAP transporter substrate-binding protein [Sulfitobacter sp. W074]|uniref:TRAP transporter substrate-binding protein n=1 Tax=Sulfitobacter sp. W074 TaxID=2867026 RepID=UPI0021A45109|nr:TRAP transporter substrate-binding protein [Sulfitobacter sp. W074]UWR38437.1 TRAP transporter substrate-binding protein [Sulfitobacter sp. W074]